MPRTPGRTPEETKKKLLEAATAEFSRRGFRKASLRRICARAGTTTGALYTHFKDKDELFFSVIAPVTAYVFALLSEHYAKEMDHPFTDRREEEAEDLRATRAAIDFYYENRTACDILLNHREHPLVEAFFDEVMALMDRQTVLWFEKVHKNDVGKSAQELDPVTIHWFSHLQVDALLLILSHDSQPELVQRRLRQMLKFLSAGLFGLLQSE